MFVFKIPRVYICELIGFDLGSNVWYKPFYFVQNVCLCVWSVYGTSHFRDSAVQSAFTRFDIHTVAQFEEHNSTVWRVCWNITGTILASSGDDGFVRLWKGKL
jgi:WD40 repeat protein